MRAIVMSVSMAGVVFVALVGAFAWLFAQNEQVREELTLMRQTLDQQSAKPQAERSGTVRSNPEMAARLDRLESSLKKLAARLQTWEDEGVIAGLSQASSLDPRSPSSTPPRFSDPYVESSGRASGAPSERSLTERGFDSVSNRISAEGVAPERAASVSQGLEELSFSNPDLTAGLSYEQPVCSESRCVVKGNVSHTKFSAARISNDTAFEAEDAYYEFLRESQKQMDNAMGRRTQVSVYRSGDEIVMRIVPKQLRQGAGVGTE